MSQVDQSPPLHRGQPKLSNDDRFLPLTSEDWQALLEQAEQQGEPLYQLTESEVQYRLPTCLGVGCDRVIHLRGGLTLQIRSGKLQQALRLEQQHETDFPLVAKFYLAGSSHVQTLNATNVAANYSETAGSHYLYYLPDQTEIEEWPADQFLHLIMIFADVSYFKGFSAGDFNLPKPLQQLLEGNITQRFHQSLGLLNPTMKQLIQQILHCPYQGLMQQLYLEGKALELLALQFSTWAEMRPGKKNVILRSHDIQQLHQAREILIRQAHQPPSLIELARQVGLNDRKLKQGFRHLFGTTVFGYLQNYRMEQAKQLLHHSDFTIAQVAAQVGYRNPEAFSTAFRRQFSVSPKVYQLKQRD